MTYVTRHDIRDGVTHGWRDRRRVWQGHVLARGYPLSSAPQTVSLPARRRWLEEVPGGSEEAPAPARAKALYGAGALAFRQGDYGRATALGEFAAAWAAGRALPLEQAIVHALADRDD